jgi:hypothetical protein
VAGSLGYCGLDRRRQPLVGDEIRACWEAWPGAEASVMAPLAIQPADPTGEHAHPIEFVEVGGGSTLPAAPAVGDVSPDDEPAIVPPGPLRPAPEPGWSLWGDTER